MSCKIRTADQDDAAAVSSLILTTASTQLRNEFSNDGWELFQRLLSVKTQFDLLRNNQFDCLVAVADSKNSEAKAIVGVLTIKDNNHLFHLFVNPQWQGQGIGRRLWKAYLEQGEKSFDNVTVNASDFAIDFYLKLGFITKQSRQIKNGVCYTPMIYSLRLN